MKRIIIKYTAFLIIVAIVTWVNFYHNDYTPIVLGALSIMVAENIANRITK